MLSGFFHRNKRLLHSNNWMKKVLTRLALNIATASYIQVIVSGTLKCKLPFDQFFNMLAKVLSGLVLCSHCLGFGAVPARSDVDFSQMLSVWSDVVRCGQLGLGSDVAGCGQIPNVVFLARSM